MARTLPGVYVGIGMGISNVNRPITLVKRKQQSNIELVAK